MSIEINIGEMEQSYESYSRKIYMFENRNLFECDRNMATYIHKNYVELLKNDQMLSDVHKKIITKQQMIKDIFTYDFLCYKPDIDEKVSTIDKLANLTKMELARYQGVVGGYGIEDDEWLNCTERFKLKSNQRGIFNTCHQKLIKNDDHTWFMRKIIKHMKKFIDTDDIDIDYKMFDDEFNEIAWIVIVFEKKEEDIESDESLESSDFSQNDDDSVKSCDDYCYCNSDCEE